MFLAYKSIIAYRCVILRSTDEHRLSDYSIGPEAKLNLVIRPSGEKTGASGAGPSSSTTQGRVWQIASTILAKHFSPADASKVHENLIKVFEYILLNNVRPSIIWSPSQWALVNLPGHHRASVQRQATMHIYLGVGTQWERVNQRHHTAFHMWLVIVDQSKNKCTWKNWGQKLRNWRAWHKFHGLDHSFW